MNDPVCIQTAIYASKDLQWARGEKRQRLARDKVRILDAMHLSCMKACTSSSSMSAGSTNPSRKDV